MIKAPKFRIIPKIRWARIKLPLVIIGTVIAIPASVVQILSWFYPQQIIIPMPTVGTERKSEQSSVSADTALGDNEVMTPHGRIPIGASSNVTFADVDFNEYSVTKEVKQGYFRNIETTDDEYIFYEDFYYLATYLCTNTFFHFANGTDQKRTFALREASSFTGSDAPFSLGPQSSRTMEFQYPSEWVLFEIKNKKLAQFIFVRDCSEEEIEWPDHGDFYNEVVDQEKTELQER